MNKEKLIQYCDLKKEIENLKKRIDKIEKQSEMVADVVQNGYKGKAYIYGYDYFNNLEEKLQYLIENEYYCKDTLNKYSLSFITNLFDFIKKHNFEFKSYMSANKFYQNYALKTNDGKEILETYNDKVLIVRALHLI